MVRRTYLQTLLTAFEDLLAPFDWEEVHLTPEVRIMAMQYVSQYNVGSQDAIHLASANWAGVTDFASLDQRLRRVDGLHLWNDLIHA